MPSAAVDSILFSKSRRRIMTKKSVHFLGTEVFFFGSIFPVIDSRGWKNI